MQVGAQHRAAWASREVETKRAPGTDGRDDVARARRALADARTYCEQMRAVLLAHGATAVIHPTPRSE